MSDSKQYKKAESFCTSSGSGGGGGLSESCGLVALDKMLTARLAVCCTEKSSLGQFRPLMRMLEYSCHGVPWLIGMFWAILASHQPDRQEKLINLFAVLLVDLIVVGLCKAVFRRTRPAQNKDDMMTVLVDCYSFPSGHTTRAVLVATFILRNFELGTQVSAWLVVWATSVAISRLLLGRHHVSDVLCGVLIGLLTYIGYVTTLWVPTEVCMGIMNPVMEEIFL